MVRLHSHLPLLFVAYVFHMLLRVSHAAFIETYQCSGVDMYQYKLEAFVVDVALDEDKKKLKFFMNSKVVDYFNMSDTNVIINDVNSTTNRYTTFHVEIDFMGHTFINENKRFCDIIAVKNDINFRKSPRFTHVNDGLDQDDGNGTEGPASTAAAATATQDISDDSHDQDDHDDSNNSHKLPYHAGSNTLNTSLEAKRDIVGNQTVIPFSTSNSTIERIFSNSTGDLVECPLYVNDSFVLYYEADISSHFHRLGSYEARFSVVANDQDSYVIGCNNAYVTPEQSDYVSSTLFIGVLVLLLSTAIINFFTVIYSSYQESSNPFLFTASTICNKNLLKQLDATVQRIILYLQFALFIAGLDLQYPGFYQPLIGQIRWCALLGIAIIRRKSLISHKSSDNIYVTLNRGGLKSLALYSTDLSVHDSWPNFMLCLCIWIVLSISAEQVFLGVKYLIDFLVKKYKRDKRSLLNDEQDVSSNYKFTFSKDCFFMLGQVLNDFLSVFGFPFLILTSFMFFNASKLNGNHVFFPNSAGLRRAAFDCRVSYDDLFSPEATQPTGAKITTTSTQSLSSSSDITYATITYATSDASGYMIPSDAQKYDYPLRNMTAFPNGTIVREISTHNQYLGIPLLNIILGSIFFVLWMSLVLFFLFNFVITIKGFKIKINKKVSRLYTSMRTILAWGFCYHTYHPNKVYFVAFDFASLVVKSLVVGCLQSHGLVQVVVLIICEFIDLMLLFTIQPNYLEMTWTTTRWILPMARFFVTTLCIPFIKELDISEAARTYVAYAQLIIHLVMALMFIVQLLYCLVSTILSVIKQRNSKRQFASCSKHEATNSIDDFNKQFEYQPIKNTIEPLKKPDSRDLLTIDTSFNSLMPYEKAKNSASTGGEHELSFNTRSNTSTIKNDEDVGLFEFGNGIGNAQVNLNDSDIGAEEEDDDYYYRGSSGKHLEKPNDAIKRDLSEKTLKDMSTPADSPVAVHDDSRLDFNFSDDVESDAQSFHKQQQRSNIRKLQNDYTFREADLIYRRYFVDASIDPEVKALWDSRFQWELNGNTSEKRTHDKRDNGNRIYEQQDPIVPMSNPTYIFSKLKDAAGYSWRYISKNDSKPLPNGNQPHNTGFQVSRPRPLVVKSLPSLQIPKHANDSFEDSEYSYVNSPNDCLAGSHNELKDSSESTRNNSPQSEHRAT